jgi:hypothetical protein
VTQAFFQTFLKFFCGSLSAGWSGIPRLGDQFGRPTPKLRGGRKILHGCLVCFDILRS